MQIAKLKLTADVKCDNIRPVKEVYADVLLKVNGKSEHKRLLVDTGATYSWINQVLLNNLGVQPIEQITFETIEGRKVKRRVGEVFAECEGKIATIKAVFAKKGEGEVLGLTALEVLGLDIDTTNKRLKEVKVMKAL